MGGFGNQIFQISFAKYLQLNGFKVYLSDDWFSSHNFQDGTTKRNLEIKISNFGINEASSLNLVFINLIDKISRSRGLKKLFNSKFNKFYKMHTGHTFNESEFFILNRFSGYWQNSKYFDDKKEFIINSLKEDELFVFNISDKNYSKTLLHIRKGDYVNLDQELPYSYYKKCLEILYSKDENLEYDIFSDDINHDFENEIFRNAQNIYLDTDEKAIETFSKMLNYKNYILSNSSFSFLAAFLSTNKKSNILYPYPWFKGDKHSAPVLDSWTKVKYE